MRPNKLAMLSLTVTVIHFCYLLSPIENAPIVPILTALATSAAGIFQIQVDTLHIAKYLRNAANSKKNRAAFVRDLVYTAFYRSNQGYNVIVFNLGEEHKQRLHGIIFYGSVVFDPHHRYGVFVFDYGVFTNLGARGWENWGMIGTFKKSPGGETIYFHRRHRSKHHPNNSTTEVLPKELLLNFSNPNAVDNAELTNEAKEKKITIKLEDNSKEPKSKSKKVTRNSSNSRTTN